MDLHSFFALHNLQMHNVVTLVLAGLTILWVGLYYNRLVALNQRCETAYSDIDVQLKHRHNVIPGLLQCVRGIMAHEQSIIDRITKARAMAISAQAPEDVLRAETQLGHSLHHLFALSEQYPDLKASVHFSELRHELSDAEGKITAARRFFNLAVEEFNVSRKQFPGNIVGVVFGMQPRRNFTLGEERGTMDQPLTFKI